MIPIINVPQCWNPKNGSSGLKKSTNIIIETTYVMTLARMLRLSHRENQSAVTTNSNFSVMSSIQSSKRFFCSGNNIKSIKDTDIISPSIVSAISRRWIIVEERTLNTSRRDRLFPERIIYRVGGTAEIVESHPPIGVEILIVELSQIAVEPAR